MLTAVFLTALELEHAAIVEHLSPPIDERTERGLVFETGTFVGRATWRIAVAQGGPANASAGVLLERAVVTFAPDVAMFVGIAGGRKDVTHGDVVAANAVYDYESGKDGGTHLPRIKTSAPSFALVQRAQSVARGDRWQDRIRPVVPARRPAAFVKPIAAGGKVVADSGSGTARLLTAYCGDALAVDMESYGFLRGAYVNDAVASLVVRGISDLLSDKTAANDGQWQVPAARNAAAFAFEVLGSLDGTGAATAASVEKSPAPRWMQVNRPAGGTVYANQGGNQTVHIYAPDEERNGTA